MVNRFLALDLGASSGRTILGELNDKDRLIIKEVNRFSNGVVEIDGHLHWNLNRILSEIHKGISASVSSRITSVGVDTWGVDFGLLDRDGKLIEQPYAYRDWRTEGAVADFEKRMPLDELYRRTGIQVLPFDTLFQLQSMVRDGSPELVRARCLLMMADLINHSFTGTAASEFTLSTTSHLYNPWKKGWDCEIIDALGVSNDLFQNIVDPGTYLGKLVPKKPTKISSEEVKVTTVACHDTASAVAAVPAKNSDFVYISSGTWSLMGIESAEPVINDASFRYNITNEGGVYGTFRVLKNIAGLWLLQMCQKAWRGERAYDYDELVHIAEVSEPLTTIINPDWPGFLNPPSMPDAIAKFCRETGQRAPRNHGEYVRAIIEGLALAYRHALAQLEDSTSKSVGDIHMVGGGSRNTLLCQLTSDATRRTVYSGPAEATAIGNLLVQAMANGRVRDLKHLRKIVRESNEIVSYEPREERRWDESYQFFKELKGEND